MKYFFCNVLSVVFLLVACSSEFNSQNTNHWTIIYYAAGCNSSEVDLLNDMQEIADGKTSEDYEFITLIDRMEGHSEDATVFGENFEDTRLYRIQNHSFEELDGGTYLPEFNSETKNEANLGDANLLKNFIRFCKEKYPADHYMLILRSHGNGYAMCPDVDSQERDPIYIAELTDVLGPEESVDILGLDVCSMAGIENLYQWRPGAHKFGADYVIASAPLSGAWAYDHILKRMTKEDPEDFDGTNYFLGGTEENLDPRTMTPRELSEMIFEEIYDNQRWASWGLFDNSKISQIKDEFDKLSVALTQEPKELIMDIIRNTLGYHHNTSSDLETAQLVFPYLDTYDFLSRIEQQKGLNSETKKLANQTKKFIDELTIFSYYGPGFLPETDRFSENKNGVYSIIPLGSDIYSQSGYSFWSHTVWYHPKDQTKRIDSYGKYDWCDDGAEEENGQVENFFEYLDFLFDGEIKDVNNYRW